MLTLGKTELNLVLLPTYLYICKIYAINMSITEISISNHNFQPFSLNLRGSLVEFTRPLVMGILNVTPDSFYSESRCQSDQRIGARVVEMLEDGADMIDIGGYSSRPGADNVSVEEETARVVRGITLTREINPDAVISVDTFRASVARKAIEAGADIVNDISGGDLDVEMYATVAELKVPYIVMHTRGTPQTMSGLTDYDDVTADVIAELSEKVNKLSLTGICDVIIDPGFGFGKTVEQNYELLRGLSALHCFNRPLLVGVSRKSMIYKPLGLTPAESLNGTTVINTLSLAQGASILRVHDVGAAVEAVKIFMMTQGLWNHSA